MERTLRDFVKNLIGGARQAKRADPSKRPPINQPYRVQQYICKNCGMHIKQHHRHTRKECQAYIDDPIKPVSDTHTLPGSNDPKVMLPFYFEVAG